MLSRRLLEKFGKGGVLHHAQGKKSFEPDLFTAYPALGEYHGAVEARAAAVKATTTPYPSYEAFVCTALSIEIRDGKLFIFLPPLQHAEAFMDLIASIEVTAKQLKMPVMLEGYDPPSDPRIEKLRVIPDPGVIEVNIHPAHSWGELSETILQLYEEARLSRLGTEKFMIDGKVSETRSYLRWEDPPLSQNGEGRISPTIPGCQTTVTVIGQEGKALLQNHIFKIPNVEGAGEEGQNAIDMSPVQPHTISKKARSCESCHTNPKAAGYGIDGGRNNAPVHVDAYVDLENAQKSLLVQNALIQFPKIANLHHDWSVMLDENGTQVQTVGHHWNLEGPLSQEQRTKLDRSGACLSCHQSIPKGDLAISAMAHMAQMAGVWIDNTMHQDILSKLLHVGAWVQILGGVAAIVGLQWWWRRRQ